MSLYVFATLRIRPEHREAVQSLLQQLVKASRTEAGCHHYQAMTDLQDSDTVHIFEEYAGEEALEAHRQSAHYQAYRTFAADKLAAPVEVRVMRELAVER